MATRKQAAKPTKKAAAKKQAPRRPDAPDAPDERGHDAFRGDIRPCPRCETADRVEPVGGEPPMLVHFGCGYTFPAEPDAA